MQAVRDALVRQFDGQWESGDIADPDTGFMDWDGESPGSFFGDEGSSVDTVSGAALYDAQGQTETGSGGLSPIVFTDDDGGAGGSSGGDVLVDSTLESPPEAEAEPDDSTSPGV
jgi:hypothetical protein